MMPQTRYMPYKIEVDIVSECDRIYFFACLLPTTSSYNGGIMGYKLNIAYIPVQSKNILSTFTSSGILGLGS